MTSLKEVFETKCFENRKDWRTSISWWTDRSSGEYPTWSTVSRWAVICQTPTYVAKQVTTMKVGGKRPRGRPRLRWMDRGRSDLRQHQLDPKLAQNREAWRKAVTAIDPGQGYDWQGWAICKTLDIDLQLPHYYGHLTSTVTSLVRPPQHYGQPGSNDSHINEKSRILVTSLLTISAWYAGIPAQHAVTLEYNKPV